MLEMAAAAAATLAEAAAGAALIPALAGVAIVAPCLLPTATSSRQLLLEAAVSIKTGGMEVQSATAGGAGSSLSTHLMAQTAVLPLAAAGEPQQQAAMPAGSSKAFAPAACF